MGPLTWRRAALIPALLLTLALCAFAGASPPTQGRVTWVDDGDSLRLASGDKVRLLGIDTPEYKDSPRDAFYRKNFGLKPSQLRRIAQAATRRVIHLAKGRTVQLRYDQTLHDRYGRLLAYVTLPDGQLLNGLLLDEGLASAYRRYDYQRKQEFLDREERARTAGRGLWQRPKK